MLLTDFPGRKLSMEQIYECHSADKPYIKTNYKKALTNMEMADKINADPPANKRRKGTFADWVVVTFPRRDSQ
jgi:hypothetical protein